MVRLGGPAHEIVTTNFIETVPEGSGVIGRGVFGWWHLAGIAGGIKSWSGEGGLTGYGHLGGGGYGCLGYLNIC